MLDLKINKFIYFKQRNKKEMGRILVFFKPKKKMM